MTSTYLSFAPGCPAVCAHDTDLSVALLTSLIIVIMYLKSSVHQISCRGLLGLYATSQLLVAVCFHLK